MDAFDFWYAVNNTEVVLKPRKQLETFGNSTVNYVLISEMMDEVNKVRIREGTIIAARPQILTPGDLLTTALDGFASNEAREYLEWLRDNARDLRFLQFGIRISKQDINDSFVSDSPQQVLDNVLREAAVKNDPSPAVVVGVESPWEVCLVKVMTEVVEQSLPANIRDLKDRDLLPLGPEELRQRIDRDFLEASRNSELIPRLFAKLKSSGLFSQHEDRFYSLVKASKRIGP